MRKTKIICTLGPSTDSPEILQAMMENGMDVARFNFPMEAMTSTSAAWRSSRPCGRN